MPGFMNARRIDEDYLPGLGAVDTLDPMPRCLRFIRDSGDLLADDAIEKRGFSGIRSAYKRGVTAVKC